jgi:hypothetical protein
VDGAAGEVDDGVGAVDFPRPVAEGLPVPRDGLGLDVAAHDDDLVAGAAVVAGEERAEVSGAAGNHDLHCVLH